MCFLQFWTEFFLGVGRESLCTPALVLNPNAKFRNIFYRPVSLFWSSEMPAVGRRPPRCGFIYCIIPTAARLSAVPSRVFSLTPSFRSYAFWQLSFSWFIPFMNVYPIYDPIYYFPATIRPLPCACTTNHSLLVVVYWYPFFTFLIPTILLLFLFSHFLTPSFTIYHTNVLCTVNCISLCSQRICFLSLLCQKKTHTQVVTATWIKWQSTEYLLAYRQYGDRGSKAVKVLC